MDTQRMRQLLDLRDEIGREMIAIVKGDIYIKDRKPPKCSICGSTEHTARTCPKRPAE